MSNKVKKTMIMDIPFVNETKDYFMRKIVRTAVENEKKCFIITANPEIVMESKRNISYKAILLEADYVVPDGVGILFAAKIKKNPLKERMAGVEMMESMLKLANEHGLSCFFFGAKEEVNQAAVANIQLKYPRLIVAGRHHGYVKLDDEAVVAEIEETAPDFVFTALGFPKQEEWIARHQERFSKGVLMGVGGSFDIFADKAKRAPRMWIKFRLEWLYRLLQQPSRLKRMLPLIAFVLDAFRKSK